MPKVTQTLRGIIIAEEKTNSQFIKASETFLKLCHDSINPNITNEDVREMIIQHILTEDVFNTIFDENQFHRENNIARELESVIQTFFTGSIRKIALGTVQHYYQAINAAAAGIADHHEKQKFLKVIYETFYKSYNPKAADRLGVVYTPNEIVQFMIKSTDYLLHKYFNKFLEDKGVEILDPATGTGTFICDMIDYMSKDKLAFKYKNELHANEVAILPYYISNLNIEFTYTQKMGAYNEFENLCFVDTLDNMDFAYRGKQIDMFSPFTEENTKRIKKQNDRKIAVIIGNPPYNANQANENDNNKNREYPKIDKRIKDTFIKYSTAQKTKVYDMYARFYRWAFDRLDSNGIVAFITNRSFIDSRTFDGFRKIIQDEFDFAYIIDTKSDVRANPKIAGTTHNIFGIQTGVAIMLLVKKFSKEKKKLCAIYYTRMQDEWRKEEKLQWLSENPLQQIAFTHIQPDKNNNWINIADNDFDSLLPLADKAVKTGKSKKALFELYSLGVVTARDEWVYDNNINKLENKVQFLIDVYNKDLAKHKGKDKKEIKDLVDYSIKWSRAVKNDISKSKEYSFDNRLIIDSLYRPYVKRKLYFSKELNEMQYQLPYLFANKNKLISISGGSASKPFATLIADSPFCYDLLEKTQSLPFYRFDRQGNRIENITDWGFNQFVKQYGKKGISKESIFHYVYAVLHNPAYRTKYELNLKRDFPRIPFYEDFKQWAAWGKALIDLHVNYETVEPYNLKETTTDTKESPKPKLKADKESGTIILDENTELTGIPKEAWTYKLGNRSALEWVLDQYKEKKPSDPTIAEKFNTYKFADYKGQVIDLLKRVCTVSVETMKIIEQMGEAK
ncbi:MAG: type ISP restriction/modification enzyme [Daejeonella sp.]